MKEKLLISACLLGAKCRYDGASRTPLSRWDIEVLSDKYELIPICPEIYGGLPTPRDPSERCGERVIMNTGRDVTDAFFLGAEQTLSLARALGASRALLKSRSPSCGKGMIYDGTHTANLTAGNGVCAQMLMDAGIDVFTEEELNRLITP